MFIKSWPSQNPAGLAPHPDYFPRPDYDQKSDYAEKIATSLPFNYFCHNVLNVRKNSTQHSIKSNRMNVASFHDWTSEKNRNQWPTSSLYQEVATLTSICSLSDPNRQPTADQLENRPNVCHKLFQPEVTDLTKGEKHIIAGLCRNSGCVLPHIDNSAGQSYLTGIKKGVSLKGRKLVSCMPPLLSQTPPTQPKVDRDCWWERHAESAPPFPLRVKYFRDYNSCSLFDVAKGTFFGYPGSANSDPMASPMHMTPSMGAGGMQAPPNTPDVNARIKNGSNEDLEGDKNSKSKHFKTSRKEVKLENGKKKTHLIVYLPKTEQEEEEEVVAAAVAATVRGETTTAPGGENARIMNQQNRKKKLANICLTSND